MNTLLNIFLSVVVGALGAWAFYNYAPVNLLETSPEPRFGSTITTIQGSDTLSSSRSVINTNFSNLNTDLLALTSTVSSLRLFDFTPATNYAALTNSTSTPLWLTAGFQASSTSYVVNLTGTAFNGGTFIGLSQVTTYATTTHASTTNLTVSNELVIPSGTSKGSTVAGQIELDTTDNQLKVGTTNFGSYRNLTFTYSTTTAFTGTTTGIQVTAPFAGTFTDVVCFTDTGTLRFRVTIDGTELGTEPNASTTVGVYNYTTNNTFSRGSKLIGYFGTPASSPTNVSCTLRATETAT